MSGCIQSKKMRVLFAGSPAFVLPVVHCLAETTELAAVMTNAPVPTGRGKKLKSSPLASALAGNPQYASSECFDTDTRNTIKLLQVDEIDEQVEKAVSDLHCDLLVCYAFGKIFTERFLSLFRFGGINIHPSLLPRWRGATPVPAAIMAGDKVTGITIQTLAKKTDAGNILAQSRYTMTGTETAGELLSKLTSDAVPLLKGVLQDFETALNNAVPQREADATYCTKITDRHIDWNKSAIDIERFVRALTPAPKAIAVVGGQSITITGVALVSQTAAEVQNSTDRLHLEKNREIGTIVTVDKKLGILVQTGDGFLAITTLQRPGKKEMNFKDFLNGYKNFIGLVFEHETT